ncbi:MAG: SIS domain-containing protein [bacterium]
MSNRRAELDSQNMAASIRALPDQCRQALDTTAALKIPSYYGGINDILIAGMGDSALGGHVLLSLYGDRLKVPVVTWNQYGLPGWVDRSTLVVLSSYSGSTAETLAAAEEAVARQGPIIGITAGGPLRTFLERHHAPYYHIVPDHNPCGQPRMALGYAVMGLLGLLWHTGLIPDSFEQGKAVVDEFAEKALIFNEGDRESLVAKAVQTVRRRLIYVVASEHLQGNAHILANQLNENAKCLATWFALPEMNHHLMEGLLQPSDLRDSVSFIFLESEHYAPAVQARYAVTQEILRDLDISYRRLQIENSHPLTEVLMVLLVGSWLSYELALAYDLDPSPIPYVDKFKRALKEKGF